MNGPKAYSPAQVAELLSLPAGEAGQRRVRRMVERGELRGVRVGKAIRIPASEIVRFLDGEAVAS